MSVSAPFRFAPIHRWVYFPEWGPLVTHDVPFRDGWSGEIELDITAVTPLLVGGARRAPKETLEGEVWPVELPGGRWAIPPSSLQGMVRSILEIATFAQLGPWIDDKRFGIRDLTPRAAPYYQRRLNQHVKAGWLRRCDGHEFKLKRCDFARISFRDLVHLTNVPLRDWRSWSNVGTRYDWVSPTERKFHVTNGKVTGAHGSIEGKVVVTGNPGATKNHEFFFFNERQEIELHEFQDRFEEFQSIHKPDDGRPENPNWKFFWEEGYPGERPFKDGGWMPIFYLDDGKGGIESFGLASMFKLAHEKRTLDLLRNSNPGHLTRDQRNAFGEADDVGDGKDLPSLIFGSVANDMGGGLKRRAAFDVAIGTLPPGGRLMDDNPTVLLGPKPNYFPIYVRQPNWSKGQLARGEPYATYTPLDEERYPKAMGSRTPEYERPELAGVKIWPATDDDDVRFPEVPDGVADNYNVQTRLRALPKGTQFSGVKLRVHNLRPVELGALLWALTFGDTEALHGNVSGKRHRLGMGKPYGLGQISICIKAANANLRPNDPTAEIATGDLKADNQQILDNAIKAFKEHMTTVYVDSGDSGTWFDSVQIQSLLKAAKPQSRDELGYMNLEQYIEARKQGSFLRLYAEGGEALDCTLPRIGARVKMLRIGTKGVIVDKLKNDRWGVLLDGQSKSIPYGQHLFTVIG